MYSVSEEESTTLVRSALSGAHIIAEAHLDHRDARYILAQSGYDQEEYLVMRKGEGVEYVMTARFDGLHGHDDLEELLYYVKADPDTGKAHSEVNIKDPELLETLLDAVDLDGDEHLRA